MNAHLLTVFAQICVTIGTSIPCSIDVVHATITQCCGMSDTREVICFVDQFEEHGPVVEGKFFVPLYPSPYLLPSPSWPAGISYLNFSQHCRGSITHIPLT